MKWYIRATFEPPFRPDREQRPDEYVGPFDTAADLRKHQEYWGPIGPHTSRVKRRPEDMLDENVITAREHIEYQKGRF